MKGRGEWRQGPESTDKWIQLSGQLCCERNDLNAAVQAFTAACAAAPELPDSHFELARCWHGLQNFEAAIAALEAGIEQGVFFPRVWLGLIQLLLLRCGRRGEAAEHLRTARVLFAGPGDAEGQAALQKLQEQGL